MCYEIPELEVLLTDKRMQKLHFKYNFNYYLCHNLAQTIEAQVMLKKNNVELKKHQTSSWHGKRVKRRLTAASNRQHTGDQSENKLGETRGSRVGFLPF